mgnify:CR=1 FL=1
MPKTKEAPTSALEGYDKEELHRLLYLMLLGRRFEDRCAEA